MDWSIVQALNGFLVHHDAVEDPSMLYVRASEALFVAFLAALFLFGRRPLRRAAVGAAASAGVALAVAALASTAIARARPFASDPSRVHLLIPHAADPGLPSDHATAAFAIATAILLCDRRWGAVMLVFATALAVGRVAAGVHFPSDVIAGALLGTVIALLCWSQSPRRLLIVVADRLDAAVDPLRPHRFRAGAAES